MRQDPCYPSRLLLQMVAELHLRGYQLLRIFSGLSSSGGSWRCTVHVVDPLKSARAAPSSSGVLLNYYSAAGFYIFSHNDAEDEEVSPMALADRCLALFPEQCAAAKGWDWPYARWFAEMVEATSPLGLPISYADYSWDKSRLRIVGMSKVGSIALPPSPVVDVSSKVVSRAMGCWFGQLAGDSLGGLVEFASAEEIAARYPQRVRWLVEGGVWGTLAGQPTDDSEMALQLARSLIARRSYDSEDAYRLYQQWFASDPFDCGATISCGLGGDPSDSSQANGALMRISPLGIFGANYDLEQVADWAQQDARLTHPHPVCQQANALFAMAIADTVRHGGQPDAIYQKVVGWAEAMAVDARLMQAIVEAEAQPPVDYTTQQGWVIIAIQNALWQLLHSSTLEQGVVNTVACGGDTDTNAAICGALLGAVYGVEAVPPQWREAIKACRPQQGATGVLKPRPQWLWPCDAEQLAAQLVKAQNSD
ncbi:MAG: ADP-ribosylglycohydrolase family protein [Mariprofundales bacterium]